MADILAKVFGLSGLKASVSQFSGTMVAQTRLDIEAEHLKRFAWNFGRWKDVAFPAVCRRQEALPRRAIAISPSPCHVHHLLRQVVAPSIVTSSAPLVSTPPRHLTVGNLCFGGGTH